MDTIETSICGRLYDLRVCVRGRENTWSKKSKSGIRSVRSFINTTFLVNYSASYIG